MEVTKNLTFMPIIKIIILIACSMGWLPAGPGKMKASFTQKEILSYL